MWGLWKKTAQSSSKGEDGDVHTMLMKRNYKEVPQLRFVVILVPMVALSIYACEGFGKQLQLPWWELVIGYLLPGKPLANVSFKTHGYISMSQALSFVSDFKLGHYMKIPPRSMFLVQIVGTVLASVVYFGTAWWLLTTIPNICHPLNMPEGSPWTCPGDDVFYNASIIWGVVGLMRMFAKQGVHGAMMNWFFLVGLLAPFPAGPPGEAVDPLHQHADILRGLGGMPPTRAANFCMWGAVGIYFNFYVYRKYKAWWARHTYILTALDAGMAFVAVMLYFTLQTKDIFGPNWWGLDSSDHCPLATCPTAPGVVAKGCPVVQ